MAKQKKSKSKSSSSSNTKSSTTTMTATQEIKKPSLAASTLSDSSSDSSPTLPTTRRTPTTSPSTFTYPSFFSRLERFFINLCLLSLITILTFDAWPNEWLDTKNQLIRRIRLHNDVFLDIIGLWQAPWYLFAPTPPSENYYITATYFQPPPNAIKRNSNYWDWKTPTWSEQSWWYKKRYFRLQEYYESIAWDGYEDSNYDGLCFLLANYLAQKAMDEANENLKNDNDDKEPLIISRIILRVRYHILKDPPTANTNKKGFKNNYKSNKQTSLDYYYGVDLSDIDMGNDDDYEDENDKEVDVPDKSASSQDSHWLLGERVQSIASEEDSYMIYRGKAK